MTIQERTEAIQRIVGVAVSNGWTPSSIIFPKLSTFLFDPDFAKSVWPGGWKERQRDLLRLIQEHDEDGAIRYIAEHI